MSYLRTMLTERGIKPKNKLGQNFLIDLNLIDLILRTAELAPEDLVLEVGSGTGSMTMRLVEQAGAVLSVEIDAAFANMAEEAIHGQRDHVSLLHADILKNKNESQSASAAPARGPAAARQRRSSSWSPTCRTPWRRR